MSDLPRGTFRSIPDPQAEVERLAEARSRPEVVLVDEVHPIDRAAGYLQNGATAVHIRITADGPVGPLEDDLGLRILGVINDPWPDRPRT